MDKFQVNIFGILKIRVGRGVWELDTSLIQLMKI